MDEFERRIQNCGDKVHHWCLSCPDFRDVMVHAESYGATYKEVARVVFNACKKEPEPYNPLNEDGTEKEAWEAFEPRCRLGKEKRKHDVRETIKRLGLDPELFEILYPKNGD